MTFFFSKYILSNYKNSSIFYWPFTKEDHKYKINNVVINFIKDPILKKRIFYSNNGFKNNTYFTKEHFVNNYIYSTHDKKLNVVYPQNIFKKKLSPFLGFFYTIESDFFTSKVQTVEYYKTSLFNFRWEQRFISHFKKYRIKQNLNYTKFKFHLISGTLIKPVIDKLEKEYKELYTYVPFQKSMIILSNSEVLDDWANYKGYTTDYRKKKYPVPVWKRHILATKTLEMLRYDGIRLTVEKDYFIKEAFGSLAKIWSWKIKKTFMIALRLLSKFLLFCGKIFTVNKLTINFGMKFIIYRSYLNLYWDKVYTIIFPRKVVYNRNGKPRKPIKFNRSNLFLTKIFNMFKTWWKPVHFMTKLISQMFKNGKHKSNYKATTLQLFRNKEIYNYITNSRILEEDYDYWDEDNKSFEELVKSSKENFTFAMHRKIFYYYKLNETILKPKPAFWTLKSLLKEYYILKNQYIHNFIEHKLLFANYVKIVNPIHIAFNYFSINMYKSHHFNNLEAIRAFRKSLIFIVNYPKITFGQKVKYTFHKFWKTFNNLNNFLVKKYQKWSKRSNFCKSWNRTKKEKIFFKIRQRLLWKQLYFSKVKFIYLKLKKNKKLSLKEKQKEKRKIDKLYKNNVINFLNIRLMLYRIELKQIYDANKKKKRKFKIHITKPYLPRKERLKNLAALITLIQKKYKRRKKIYLAKQIKNKSLFYNKFFKKKKLLTIKNKKKNFLKQEGRFYSTVVFLKKIRNKKTIVKKKKKIIIKKKPNIVILKKNKKKNKNKIYKYWAFYKKA